MIKSFKQFIKEDISEIISREKEIFKDLPEEFKHFVYLAQSIQISKHFDNNRLQTLDVINYCMKNFPETVYEGKGYRCNYINTDKLIDYLVKGKTVLTEMGYYSFSRLDTTDNFNSSKRHYIAIKKDDIRGIKS